MTREEIQSLLEKQRTFYRSGATIPIHFRIEQLKKLYEVIRRRRDEINDALQADLGKSRFESFMCESGLVLTEISYMIRHTPRFARRQPVRTPLAQFASRSYRQPVPYGNTLIMSSFFDPWPLNLELPVS